MSYELGRLAGMLLVAAFVVAVIARLVRGGAASAAAATITTTPVMRSGPPPVPGQFQKMARQKNVPQAPQILPRVAGLCMLLAGVAVFFVAEAAVRKYGVALLLRAPGKAGWPQLAELWAAGAAATLMPALACAGLVLLAAGCSRTGFFLGVLMALAGLAAGVLFALGMTRVAANPLHGNVAAWMDGITDRMGYTQPPVSRATLDAELADVRTEAAQIAVRRQSVNPADKAAQADLQKEIDAYNTHQAAVKKLYDAYIAGMEASVALRRQIVGTWREQETFPAGRVLTKTRRFAEDGTMHLDLYKDYGDQPMEASKADHVDGQGPSQAQVYSATMALDGAWTVNGKSLVMHIPREVETEFGYVGDETMTVEGVDGTLTQMTVTTGKGEREVWVRM